MVFVIVLIILAAFVYFVVINKNILSPPSQPTPPSSHSNKTTNTIIPPNTILPSNTITPGKNSTNSTLPNSNFSYTNCISHNATVPITNGNFSTGTYEGWNLTGQGFLNSIGAAIPINIIFANENGEYLSSPWSNYNGNYFASTYHGGISLSPGNLTSAPFQVKEPYLNFRVISARNSLLYVELLRDGKPVIRNYYDTLDIGSNSTHPQSAFVNATMPLFNFVCKNVSIKVIAGVVGTISTTHDFIAVGDFVQSSTNVQNPSALINSTRIGSTS